MAHILSSHANLQTGLAGSLERIRHHHSLFGNLFPTVGEKETRYKLTENTNWLTGFWPGLLWLAYVATEDEDLRTRAETLLPSFLGFLFTLSARAQGQMTGDREARELALRAAEELVQRYRPQGKYIQAWGVVGDPIEGGRMIVDTMMNLSLLFWASKQTGDPRYQRAAQEHAEMSLRYLLRPDEATYHTFSWIRRPVSPSAPAPNRVTPMILSGHEGKRGPSMVLPWRRNGAKNLVSRKLLNWRRTASWSSCRRTVCPRGTCVCPMIHHTAPIAQRGLLRPEVFCGWHAWDVTKKGSFAIRHVPC